MCQMLKIQPGLCLQKLCILLEKDESKTKKQIYKCNNFSATKEVKENNEKGEREGEKEKEREKEKEGHFMKASLRWCLKPETQPCEELSRQSKQQV